MKGNRRTGIYGMRPVVSNGLSCLTAGVEGKKSSRHMRIGKSAPTRQITVSNRRHQDNTQINTYVIR